MITDKHFRELEKCGYTVVDDVITGQECDQAVAEYRTWLGNFGDKFPKSYNSIINDYNTGHLETTWRLRLRTKSVFSQIWKTEKLLTSFDAIAIGRPPEDGEEEFQVPGKYWLHADWTTSRVGLHAYQGALYLEEQTKKDWTFVVIEGSHKYLENLLDNNPGKAVYGNMRGFHKLSDQDVDGLEKKGCRLTRVPVKKGGMVLWDSRLVHANARPLSNRKTTAGKWRFVTFISMTPAIWASDADIQKHQEAYMKPSMTTHWSSEDIQLLHSSSAPGIPYPNQVPDIAQTEEAMRMSGVLLYDFNDGKPNGDSYIPKWKNKT